MIVQTCASATRSPCSSRETDVSTSRAWHHEVLPMRAIEKFPGIAAARRLATAPSRRALRKLERTTRTLEASGSSIQSDSGPTLAP